MDFGVDGALDELDDPVDEAFLNEVGHGVFFDGDFLEDGYAEPLVDGAVIFRPEDLDYFVDALVADRGEVLSALEGGDDDGDEGEEGVAN